MMIVITDEMKKDFKECARLFTNLTYLSSISAEQAEDIGRVLRRQSDKMTARIIAENKSIEQPTND